jgi:hypothetical protein
MTTKTRGLGWVALLGGARLLGLPLGHGDDLFRMSGMTTDGLPPVSFSTSSQSIPTLVEDLVLGSGAFGNLANRSVLANLDYASVAQALQFRIDRLPGGDMDGRAPEPVRAGPDPPELRRPDPGRTREPDRGLPEERRDK